MKIATKTGDKGDTSLFRGGRVSKSNSLIMIVGAIDELSATIGMAKAIMPIKNKKLPDFSHYHMYLEIIQRNLIYLMGELSCDLKERSNYIKRHSFLQLSDREGLDDEVAFLEEIPELEQNDWVLYGKNDLSSRLDFASKVCRRVERIICFHKRDQKVRPVILEYINRLSDYLYLLARYADYVL